MTDLTLFVGLDVHKKTISVALVDTAIARDVLVGFIWAIARMVEPKFA